jgi:hypothetical protein
VSEYNEEETERCHTFCEPLRGPGPYVGGELPNGQFKHAMRNQGPGATTDDLYDRVQGGISPHQLAPECLYEGHGRIEVGTAHRA